MRQQDHFQAGKATLSAHARRARGGPAGCRRKFLRWFPGGFHDEVYVEWERAYKWDAHERWRAELGADSLDALIRRGEHGEIARRAIRIEGRTNLLFSFEKMALRDAVRSEAGARRFATALRDLLHGPEELAERFERWCGALEGLPRRQTRVATWPLATVFGFLAQPKTHMFLKPNVTRRAARAWGFDFEYRSRPAWPVYAGLLSFARAVRHELRDLRPRDGIDVQSFLWVQGSDEYPDRTR